MLLHLSPYYFKLYCKCCPLSSVHSVHGAQTKSIPLPIPYVAAIKSQLN